MRKITITPNIHPYLQPIAQDLDQVFWRLYYAPNFLNAVGDNSLNIEYFSYTKGKRRVLFPKQVHRMLCSLIDDILTIMNDRSNDTLLENLYHATVDNIFYNIREVYDKEGGFLPLSEDTQENIINIVTETTMCVWTNLLLNHDSDHDRTIATMLNSKSEFVRRSQIITFTTEIT